MINRLKSLFVAVVLFAGSVPALASQGSGCMPTTGIISGLTVANNINAAIAAIISSNSGNSAPATDCTAAPVKGQIWLDLSVSPNHLRLYDGASWLDLGAADSTGHLFTPPYDSTIGSTRGALAERGSSGWTGVAPGANGSLLLSGGSGADPAWQAPGTSGQRLVGQGATSAPQWKTPATLTNQPSNPTGTSTTAMMGLGGSATVTPTTSGRVFAIVTGQWSGTLSAANASSFVLRYGSGTAPSNGATTIPGTAISQIPAPGGVSNGSQNMFVLSGMAIGLTLGTAYWFDVEVGSSAGVTTISQLSIQLVEM